MLHSISLQGYGGIIIRSAAMQALSPPNDVNNSISSTPFSYFTIDVPASRYACRKASNFLSSAFCKTSWEVRSADECGISHVPPATILCATVVMADC